jgi:hypothetical protein
LIFTPNNSNNIEKKFGRNIQALTFALPLKKGTEATEKSDCHPEQSEGQKIFESWETIAL